MDNTIVIAIEEAQSKLKELILNAVVSSDLKKELIKAKCVELINEYKAKLEELGANEELISEFELGMKQTFINWYTYALSRLKEVIEVVPKNGKTIVEETLSRLEGVKTSTYTNSITITDRGAAKIEVTNLRDYLTYQEVGQASYARPYVQPVKQALVNIERDIINGSATLIDSKGRTKSLRNMAEMTVRFQMIADDAKKLKDKNIKFVIASAHANASERCSYWQGKIFLIDLDIESREIVGFDKRNPPKPNVLGYIDGKPYYSLKQAVENGFLGYNCQHKLIEYKKGMQPINFPMKEVEFKRKLASRQRYLERKIRNAKEMEKSPFLSQEERKQAIARSKELQATYTSFCEAHNLPIFKWRTRITLVEREQPFR